MELKEKKGLRDTLKNPKERAMELLKTVYGLEMEISEED